MLHTHYDYYLLKEHGTVFFLTTNQLQPAYQPQKPSAEHALLPLNYCIPRVAQQQLFAKVQCKNKCASVSS